MFEKFNDMSKEERERLEKLTPRPDGLTPGTMAYQEHFRPGTSSISVLKAKAVKETKQKQNKPVLPKEC